MDVSLLVVLVVVSGAVLGVGVVGVAITGVGITGVGIGVGVTGVSGLQSLILNEPTLELVPVGQKSHDAAEDHLYILIGQTEQFTALESWHGSQDSEYAL